MGRPSRTRTTLAAALGLALAALPGCSSGDPSDGSSSGTISYWLWDANQRPAYEACAKDFERENPGLKVEFTQVGWAEYWTKLTASFIAGTQPDVFTDHIQKFGQFVDLEVLQPLDELAETKGIEDSDYQPNLASAWIGEDGHRYGAPKDWDTVALFFNQKMVKEAGITQEQLANLDWNPEDGGSFEKVIARLTVDGEGRRGDEPGFDRNDVKVHGLATNGAGDGDGQTTWSPFAGSADWEYTNKKRWGDRYNYDSETFQSVIDWYFGLADKGYLAPFSSYNEQSNQANAQVAAGRAATAFDGSWMLSTYDDFRGMEVGVAPTPVGPSGERATMMNGLADSVTKNARNKAGAAKWVAYLASDDCQRTVGEHGIVFPASPAGTRAAVAAYQKRGLDTTPFTQPVADGTTFSFPITNYAADVVALMKPAMQDIYANGTSVRSLDETNDQINLLLSQ